MCACPNTPSCASSDIRACDSSGCLRSSLDVPPVPGSNPEIRLITFANSTIAQQRGSTWAALRNLFAKIASRSTTYTTCVTGMGGDSASSHPRYENRTYLLDQITEYGPIQSVDKGIEAIICIYFCARSASLTHSDTIGSVTPEIRHM